MSSVALPVISHRPTWRVAQSAALLATVVLIAALWVYPRQALHLLWDMVIPLLPAAFLVNPFLWRNVCPLATLNEFTGSRRTRAMPPRLARLAWAIGIALLFLMVPARRFLFNTNGPALAVTIAAVSMLALTGGLVYARRAGFCASVCPVLPVEKLYGQSPLLPVPRVRCDECSSCIAVGCVDLATTKTVAQTIGRPRRDGTWLRTSFGAFAAAFPGFIAGYFTLPNGDLTTAATVYGRVLGLAAASYALVALLALATRVRSATAMPVLAALSLGLYYWFASPSLTAAYGGGVAAQWVLRALVAVLLLVWLRRGVARGVVPLELVPTR